MTMPRIRGIIAALLILSACQTSSDQGSGNAAAAVTEDKEAGLQPLYDAIAAYPDSVLLYEKLVDTLANRGRYADAAAWCDSAIRRMDNPPVAWLFIKGDLYRMGRMHDSAIAAYRQYLQVFPDDEQILLNLANTLAEKGDPATVELCRQIADRYPTRATRASIHFIRGVYYNQIKEYPIARKWLDSAIVYQYNFNEAWMERGYSFFDEEKFTDAEKNFRRLTEISSSYADGWYWLGKSAEALAKPEQAIRYYERAYALDRNITEARRAIERLRKQ